MGLKYLWDTNTAVYFLQQQFPPGAEEFMDEVVRDEQPVISVITEIELLCWKTVTEKDEEIVHLFIKDAIVLELEQSIKRKTAELRKAYKIKLPDAIIAATALVNSLSLISRNVSDFNLIEGIKLINPWDR